MRQKLNIQAKGEYGHVLIIQGVIGIYPLISEEFKHRLEQVPDKEPLEVRISCQGGDPLTGVQMYRMLKAHAGQVTTIIEDHAYSAVTLPLAAGDVRIIDETIGQVMIHDPAHEVNGFMDFREEDHRSLADLLKYVKEQMRNIYVQAFGVSEQKVMEWMSSTKFFNAKEAVAAGVCTKAEAITRLTEPDEDNNRMAAHYREKISNEGGQPSENKKSTKQNTTMEYWEKLKAAWNMDKDADEVDTVVHGKDFQEKNDQLKADNSDMQENLDELKKERDSLQEQLDEKQKDEQESAEEEMETTLTAMVDNFQIKAAEKEELAEEYADNLKGLKALQARIPEGAVKGGKRSKVQAKGATLTAAGVSEGVGKHFKN